MWIFCVGVKKTQLCVDLSLPAFKKKLYGDTHDVKLVCSKFVFYKCINMWKVLYRTRAVGMIFTAHPGQNKVMQLTDISKIGSESFISSQVWWQFQALKLHGPFFLREGWRCQGCTVTGQMTADGQHAWQEAAEEHHVLPGHQLSIVIEVCEALLLQGHCSKQGNRDSKAQTAELISTSGHWNTITCALPHAGETKPLLPDWQHCLPAQSGTEGFWWLPITVLT